MSVEKAWSDQYQLGYRYEQNGGGVSTVTDLRHPWVSYLIDSQTEDIARFACDTEVVVLRVSVEVVGAVGSPEVLALADADRHHWGAS